MSRARLLFRRPFWSPFLLLPLLTCGFPSGLPGHTTLIAPNGGENLLGGQTFQIKWIVAIPHALENWDLWYSTTSEDGPWTDIAMNLGPGDPSQGSLHSYAWLVPSITADQAWVRVRMDNTDEDYFDVSDMSFAILAGLACDFNGDGACGIDDLNALLAAGPIASGVVVVPGVNQQFDLDANGTLDLADLERWRMLAAAENGLGTPYKLGDANLDGVVDGADFIDWNSHKFASSLRWDYGNFNGDGVVDGADFILWNVEKFQSSTAMIGVPEPEVGMVVCFLLAFLSRRVG